MKTILSIMVAFIACVACSVWGEAPKKVVVSLTASPASQAIIRTRDLPRQIQLALARAFHQKVLYLADPKAAFQETDLVITKPGEKLLPTRRLLFGFAVGKHFVVYYESGGNGLGANALIFTTEREKLPSLVWGAVEVDYEHLAKTPTELIERIRGGRLIDDLPFSW